MIDLSTFPYKDVFEKLENTLLKEGSREISIDKIKIELSQYKNIQFIPRTDAEYYQLIVMVVFYSGFKAQTVTSKKEIILGHFSDWEHVANYTEVDIERIMNDPGMIANENKIRACVNNAKAIKNTVNEFGSMHKYIESFNPNESAENLLLLKENLESKFSYLGKITVYHFMTDIGLNVLKPDRVICRIFKRLGLIADENQLLSTVLQGRKFQQQTGHSIRYIDIVLVAYGQVEFLDLGIKNGICLNKPRCEACPLKSNICNYS
jgi:DNA-3-methyladenine glycosylase I